MFSNFFTKPLTNALFQTGSEGHHKLTHDEPGEQPKVHEIVVSTMGSLAYLLEGMKAVPEGDGTLLAHWLANNEGGGFGSIVGRNSFQRPHDEGVDLLKKVMAIYGG